MSSFSVVLESTGHHSSHSESAAAMPSPLFWSIRGFLVSWFLFAVYGAALKDSKNSRQKRSDPAWYYYESSGHIENNGYYSGYNYNNNENLTYIIKPDICQTVTCILTLHYQYDIEYSNSCVYDRLVFPYEGAVLCGMGSSTDQVEMVNGEFPIVFSSDVTVTRRGYSIDYTVQPVTTPAPTPSVYGNAFGRSLDGAGHQTELWGDSGNFYSPNYPTGGNYPYNFDQVYVAHLDSQGPQMVRVTYEYDIESTSYCLYDYIIFDDTEQKLCGIASGYEDILVDDGIFTVTFHSDNSVVKRGFNLTYTVLPQEPQPMFNARLAAVDLPSVDVAPDVPGTTPPSPTDVPEREEIPLPSPAPIPVPSDVMVGEEFLFSTPPVTPAHVIYEGCDPNWVRFADYCYTPRMRRYTFSQAEDDCRQRFDAVVAPAKDEEEFNFLQSLVAGIFPEDRPYWLGADDRDTEGVWIWADGSPVTYSVWAHGTNDPTLADERDCLVVGASGKWRDNECDKLRRFVCKKPAAIDSPTPVPDFATTTDDNIPVTSEFTTPAPPYVTADAVSLPWETMMYDYTTPPPPEQGCPESEIYVSGNSGVLESPGYPDMYPNNCDVTYYVTLDQAGPQTVDLTYNDFELEWHSQCAYDSLVLNDDDGNPQCGEKTGENVEVPVDGQSFSLRFHSDGSVISRGFSIVYSVQEPAVTPAEPEGPTSSGWLSGLGATLGNLKEQLWDLGAQLLQMTSRIDDVDTAVGLNRVLPQN